MPRGCGSIIGNLSVFQGAPSESCTTHDGVIWWRHQMGTFSALLALCAGHSPVTGVTGEFPSQRPVTRSFAVFFDLCLNKRFSKQSRRWWFETPSCSLWRHLNHPTTLLVVLATLYSERQSALVSKVHVTVASHELDGVTQITGNSATGNGKENIKAPRY